MAHTKLLKPDDMKRLLLEDLAHKKEFTATWDTECGLCFDAIYEGDTFVFIGNGRKCCNVCFEAITEMLDAI